MNTGNALKDMQDLRSFLDRFVNYEHRPDVKYDSKHYDLREFRRLLTHVSHPEKKLRCIHIAGTKGKGSTAVMIAAVLQSSGHRTGLFTSPHLVDLRERFRINGKAISEKRCIEVMNRMLAQIGDFNTEERRRYRTVFELLTLLSFVYFSESNVDWAVFEVGMGGRLDCTNVIVPEISVITPVSFDHVQSLGTTLVKIAWEKAGIIKPGVPVVCAEQASVVKDVIEQRARMSGAEFFYVPDHVHVENIQRRNERVYFDLEIDNHRFRSLELALSGNFQIHNAVSAVAAVWLLNRTHKIDLKEKALRFALKNISWPGRMQWVGKEKIKPFYSNIDTILLDGAHNPMAAHYLAGEIRERFPRKNIDLIIGVPSNKDINGIVRELAPVAGKIIVTRYRNPRSLPVEKLREYAVKYHSNVVVSDGLDDALSLGKGNVVVTGSLLLVGELISLLELDAGVIDLWQWEKITV